MKPWTHHRPRHADANSLAKLSVRGQHAWLLIFFLLIGSGASCPRQRTIVNDHAPVVLTPQSSLEEIIRVVNANSARVRQVEADGATLRIDGLPPLETSYALERPRRFRLRAGISRMTGPELDMGSNDELYWMWVGRSDPPAVYWGRHDEYERSAAQRMLPVSPDWLIEALGVVEMDPLGRHDGPQRTQPGQLEIRTHLDGQSGAATKITVIDDARGWILEQHLLDANQQPLASAIASGFEFDPVHGVSLPRFVEIRIPSAQLNFTLQTDSHRINELSGNPAQLWTLPEINGSPLVNLANPQLSSRGPVEVAQRPIRSTRPSGGRPAPARDAAIKRLPPFDRYR